MREAHPMHWFGPVCCVTENLQNLLHPLLSSSGWRCQLQRHRLVYIGTNQPTINLSEPNEATPAGQMHLRGALKSKPLQNYFFKLHRILHCFKTCQWYDFFIRY